jgi:hypothetical protein
MFQYGHRICRHRSEFFTIVQDEGGHEHSDASFSEFAFLLRLQIGRAGPPLPAVHEFLGTHRSNTNPLNKACVNFDLQNVPI